MATIEIDKREFDELVRREFDKEKLIEEASLLGVHWHNIDGNVCEVENYPNRPDCLSVEGLARAYRGFFDIETGRTEYEAEEGEIEVGVDNSVEDVRPHIGGAVVRGLDLNKKVINGLIQLQEKIHETMGKKRDKLAIGLHDLSTVEPPFTYKPVKPEKVSFKPLEYNKIMQLGEILDEHEKGQEYAWILEDEDRYPIIEDKDGQVLSFPPIINNQLTEVYSGTEDIFIDVTGKDRETVMKALNIMTTALAERGGDIESVEIDGEEMPDLSPEKMKLDPNYFREISGLELSKSEIIERLEMMKYNATAGEEIKVETPCYRNDVMHQYDLIEDVIIAHRYTNIDPELPDVHQIGNQRDIEDVAQLVRDIMSGAGAMETMTYVHSSEEDLTDRMSYERESYVKIENPMSEEYSAVRDLMLPSLLDVLEKNKHRSYPQKFFETGNVVILDNSGSGASNKKKAAFVQIGDETDFNNARKKLQVLESDLGIDLDVKEEKVPYFHDDRTAVLELDEERIGVVGEFSTEVLGNWDLDKPVAGFEIDLDLIQERLKK
jgi:phenylalanyl-tRNA synthetase beta chain